MMSRALFLAALLVASCTPRQDLPSPRVPLTPSPDAAFRAELSTPSLEIAPLVPEVSTHQLANGLRVYIAERSDYPIVSVRYVNRAAIGSPPGRPNLGSLTAAALLHSGPSRRTADTPSHQLSGRPLMVQSGPQGTVLGYDILAPYVQDAFSHLADVVEQPAIDSDGFAQARKESLKDIDDRALLLVDILQSLPARTLYGANHAFAADNRALWSATSKYSLANVKEYYQQTYVPSESALVVVGAVSTAEVIRLAEESFGKWPARKAVPIDIPSEFAPVRKYTHAFIGELPLVSLAVILPAVPESDPRYHAFALLSRILGGGISSRLNSSLRVHGAKTYGVSATLETHRTGGHMLVMTAVRGNDVYETLTSATKVLRSIRDRGVAPEELATAKATYLRDLSPENNAQYADTLCRMFSAELNLEHLRNTPTEVSRLRSDDIQRLLTQEIDPDLVSFVLYGVQWIGQQHREQLGRWRSYLPQLDPTTSNVPVWKEPNSQPLVDF